jgi:hypothetical protein
MMPFKGFTGVASAIRIGEVECFILADSVEDLERVYDDVFRGDGEPFNPELCRPSILINKDLFTDV